MRGRGEKRERPERESRHRHRHRPLPPPPLLTSAIFLSTSLLLLERRERLAAPLRRARRLGLPPDGRPPEHKPDKPADDQQAPPLLRGAHHSQSRVLPRAQDVPERRLHSRLDVHEGGGRRGRAAGVLVALVDGVLDGGARQLESAASRGGYDGVGKFGRGPRVELLEGFRGGGGAGAGEGEAVGEGGRVVDLDVARGAVGVVGWVL
jgi:hypothetical protein